MKRIALLLLPLILAALACSLTNEVRTTIDAGVSTSPRMKIVTPTVTDDQNVTATVTPSQEYLPGME